MSALKCRQTAIIAVTGVDLTDKEGYLVEFDGAGVHSINNSATVPAVAVVLEANVAAKDSSIGILGALEGSVRMKAGGTFKKGDRVKQKNDGTVELDGGSGARVTVGVALEDAVSGDLVEVAPIAPMIGS